MSNSNNSDVSVVILTKNSQRTLEECLSSAINQEPGEILIVDGQSKDSTLDIAKRRGVKIIIDLSDSLGHSRQRGVEAAKGTFVMFLDSDAVLAPGCISTLRRELKRYGWTGIHATVLSAENVSYWQRAEDQRLAGGYNRVGPVKQLDTSATMFRRAALIACPFDPFFRESNEDVDISIRLLKHGYRLGGSAAIAYHYHRREFLQFARQRFRGGLGRARLGIKYRKATVLVEPLSVAVSRTAHSLCRKDIRFVPYWAVAGFVEFLGVAAGLSKTHFGATSHSRNTVTAASSSYMSIQA